MTAQTVADHHTSDPNKSTTHFPAVCNQEEATLPSVASLLLIQAGVVNWEMQCSQQIFLT
jgi:hypothetical protein